MFINNPLNSLFSITSELKYLFSIKCGVQKFTSSGQIITAWKSRTLFAGKRSKYKSKVLKRKSHRLNMFSLA